MNIDSRPKKFSFPKLSQLVLTRQKLIVLDLILIIVCIFMIFAEPITLILLFHIVFVVLTLGAFFWNFRDFSLRASFWVTITTVLILKSIVDGKTYVGELVELPLLTSILVLVFLIAEERSKAKEKLRISEEKYHTLFDNLYKESRDAIFITNQAGVIVDANQAMLEFFDCVPEEFMGSDFTEIQFLPFDLVELRRQVGQSGSIKDYDVKIQKKDGTEMNCLVTLSLWRAIDGANSGYQVVIRDITPRKQAEAAREHLLVTEREQRIVAETLGDVFLALTAQTSYERVLDEILRQVQRVVSYSAANIMILKRGTLYIARHQGYHLFSSRELMPNLKQSLRDFPLDAAVVQSRQPMLVVDTMQNPRWITLEESTWIRSFIAVPICLRDRVLGLLRLDSDVPGKFSAEDMKRLQPLANAAAIALDNARLYDQARQEIADQTMQAETEIIQLNQKLLNLQYASATIASSLQLQSVLNNIPREMAGLLKVNGCIILQWDRASKAVSIVARHGFDRSWVDGSLTTTFPLDEYPLINRVVVEHIQEQITISLASTYPAELAMMQALNLKTLLMVPMEFQNRVIGLAAILDDQEERTFSNREIGLIQILANQIASVIANNRLYEQIRQEMTERMHVEEELRQVAAKNQAILETISDSILYLSRYGEILDYKVISNDNWPVEILSEVAVGKNLNAVLPPDLAYSTQYYIRAALDSNSMQIFEYEWPLSSDASRYFEVRLVVSGHNEVLAIVRDITRRKQQEAALENERARLARDLHDSLGQSLGFLRLKLDALTTNNVRHDLEGTRQELIQMRDVTNEAYELVRSMLAAARSTNSADVAEVLLAQARSAGNRARFKVQLTGEGQVRHLPPIIQQQVVYIFKEALNNIEKHAGAQQVDINLAWAEDVLTISLSDDGVGFNTSLPPAEDHFGLTIMQQRATEVCGVLSITSSPHTGTEVALQLPLTSVNSTHPALRQLRTS